MAPGTKPLHGEEQYENPHGHQWRQPGRGRPPHGEVDALRCCQY